MVTQSVFLRNPLTRPAPAGKNAGSGPPSPPRGRGKSSRFIAVCFLPSAFRFLLSAFCFLPSAFCFLPCAFLLSVFCLLLSAFYFASFQFLPTPISTSKGTLSG